MTKLTNRQCYEYMLIDNYWDTLENMSAGNADIIADMLAGALCYAESNLRIECPKESQITLLQITIEALLTPSEGLLTSLALPFTPIHEIATVAVIRYRACVIKELGGNQTPCISDEV